MKAQQRILRLLQVTEVPLSIVEIADITRTSTFTTVRAIVRLEDRQMVASAWIANLAGPRRRVFWLLRSGLDAVEPERRGPDW